VLIQKLFIPPAGNIPKVGGILTLRDGTVQEYESRIQSLQKQVDLAQSQLISSGCSSWNNSEFILSKSLLAEGIFSFNFIIFNFIKLKKKYH
jgi:hypothetical protein